MDQSNQRNTEYESRYTTCNKCGALVLCVKNKFSSCACGNFMFWTTETATTTTVEDSVFCLPCGGCGVVLLNGLDVKCEYCGGTGFVLMQQTKEEQMSDTVNHPMHYNKGKIEPIDAIEDWKLSFNLGNTVKYIARAPHKANQVEDLKKAYWYLTRELVSMLNVNRQDLANIIMNIKR